MSKIFIPTANCGKAHDADIFGVAICNTFTVTCSGDGYIKLWKNKLLDNEQPKDHVQKQFVHKSGVHHIDLIDTVEKGGVNVCIISCVTFSGEIVFFELTQENQLKPIKLLTEKELKKSYWAVKWLQSSDLTVCHKFAATDVKGSTYVWDLSVFQEGTADSDEPQYNPHLKSQGEIPVKEPCVATALDISSNGLIATGLENGTVFVSQLTSLKPLYQFEGYGLHGIDQNSNTVRNVKFSPTGRLLAVANDSGSYGNITLYETEFGERIGNFTMATHSTQTSIGSFAHDGWVFGLAFNETGEFLASCGYDSKVRVWDVKLRERVSTLHITAGDIEVEEDILQEDEEGNSLKHPPIFDVKFIKKGVRAGMGSDVNEGLCCVCLDRSVRWYREAGGS